jgi:hypothetical protein
MATGDAEQPPASVPQSTRNDRSLVRLLIRQSDGQFMRKSASLGKRTGPRLAHKDCGGEAAHRICTAARQAA